ncbi:MAG: hypothetical protein LBP63_08930 [Prevotellaceae bacterium]|jgi:hypothetical protein|nr:hypothetical protein [Prevotellaceae bacterium]
MKSVILLCLWNILFPAQNFELKIYNCEINDDKLTLYYSIKNNTDECHHIYLGEGWSTIPYLLNMSVLLTVNNEISLHISNPFSCFPCLKHEAILPNDSINSQITIYLNQLYESEFGMATDDDTYVIDDSDTCSFQMIYFNKRLIEDNKRKIKYGKKTKTKCVPIADTLRSNIVSYNNKSITYK